jgi:hypothetical protein
MGTVILLVVGIAIGTVGLVVSKPIYTAITEDLDALCVIENSLKQMVHIEIVNEMQASSSGPCEFKQTVIRAIGIDHLEDSKKDIENKVLNTCPELVDKYGDEIDKWAESPTDAVHECTISQIMHNVNRCWGNYLSGEAAFGTKCSEICFAPRLLSYPMDKKSGEITIPKFENDKLFIYLGEFNANDFTLAEYDNKKTFSQAQAAEFRYLARGEDENSQTIEYTKYDSAEEYTLVLEFSSPEIDLNRVPSKFPQAYKTSDRSITTGELWSVSYVGYDVDAIEGAIAGGSAGAYYGGIAGAAAGSAIGIAVAVAYADESYILLENIGSC